MANPENCVKPGTATNGLKAFGGVLVVITIILGVYGMTEPMGQRITFLKDQVESLRKELDVHRTTDAHSGARASLATINTKFAEVETQFKWLRDTTNIRLGQLEAQTLTDREWMAKHDLRVAPLNARQWERIKALERTIYGKTRSTEP